MCHLIEQELDSQPIIIVIIWASVRVSSTGTARVLAYGFLGHIYHSGELSSLNFIRINESSDRPIPLESYISESLPE